MFVYTFLFILSIVSCATITTFSSTVAASTTAIKTTAAYTITSTTATSEKWYLKNTTIFSVDESNLRRQGIANDIASEDSYFFYSSFHSIVKTESLNGIDLNLNYDAIPSKLKLLYNSDHIGCIDYYNHVIYAPIEDSDDYMSPYVVLFNSTDLTVMNMFLLSANDQMDGIPYITIHAERNVAYTSQFDDVSRINVYDVDTFTLIDYIKNNTIINGIQGGKVYNHHFYLTADSDTDNNFAIYQVNLVSGDVIKLIDLPDDIREVEGLSFTINDNNYKTDIMNVLAIRDIDNDVANKLKIRIAEVLTYVIDEK